MKGDTTLSYLYLENETARVRSYEASAGKLQPAGLNEQISSDRRRLNTDGHMDVSNPNCEIDVISRVYKNK